ncbi:hypothetical protein [Micromonospora coerulea]|uniref:hypothetical protein n=1 Tax=Micromonospora coerulea TaxID=47856 RepID=UPI00190599D2|nr:hypothetical protein [Micromonospora veneta]
MNTAGQEGAILDRERRELETLLRQRGLAGDTELTCAINGLAAAMARYTLALRAEKRDGAK